jgi:hypothetical protein
MLDAVPVKTIPPRLSGVEPGSNLPRFEILDKYSHKQGDWGKWVRLVVFGVSGGTALLRRWEKIKLPILCTGLFLQGEMISIMSGTLFLSNPLNLLGWAGKNRFQWGIIT